jgi:ABC-2 type transport system ATP-binding protein
MSMIHVEDVSKNFGTITAVSGASFDVEAGSIFGLVGSDGAGKTTLLRMLAAMIRPTSGKITIDGMDAVGERRKVKEKIGYMPQRFGLYADLTVAENLDFFMDIYGITGPERKKRKQYFLGFSNLTPFTGRAAGDLSGGMKQKLGLACVLVHRPAVLVLDEPTNGVDPVSRLEFWDILTGMRKEGMTVLIATAYLDEGERCDRLILVHQGKILAQGAPGEIREGFSNLEEAVIHRIAAVEEG